MLILNNKTYLTEKEASKKYGYSTAWFQKQRHENKPPQYMKYRGKGKIFYDLEETDKWFQKSFVASNF